jgi:RNA polymerase sigma-70 factor (ECF subfamily)
VIRSSCPSCNTQHTSPFSEAGKKVFCSSCGQKTLVAKRCGNNLPAKEATAMGAEATEHTRQAPRSAAEDEARLIRAAQAGDRSAFAPLVEAYWGRLYRWLYHLTHDRHQAEDLAQEAFLKAFAHVGRFRAGTNFRAWLFRIAHNSFANQHRGAARRRAALPDDLPNRDQGPVERALSREALAGLAEALERLPTDFRAALLLRVEEGWSFKQIADVLDTTEETARWRVFKARQKLLAQLDEGKDERSSPQVGRERGGSIFAASWA